MIAACQNADFIIDHLIDQAVLVIDAPRPASSQLVLQGFRLAYAPERLALHSLDQSHDALSHLTVILYPPGQVREPRLVKLQVSQGLLRAEYRPDAA